MPAFFFLFFFAERWHKRLEREPGTGKTQGTGAGTLELPAFGDPVISPPGSVLPGVGVGAVGPRAPKGRPPPTSRGDRILTASRPGRTQSQVCRMKINKIDTMAKNTKHVGLLLYAFVKFFLLYVCVCFYLLLAKQRLQPGSGPPSREMQNIFWSPPTQGVGGGRLVHCPLHAQTSPSPSGRPCRLLQRGVRNLWARSASGRRSCPCPSACPLGRCPPPPTFPRLTTYTPPGAAPPPLPRALPGALNNDICMQGAIHKYVRAGEI